MGLLLRNKTPKRRVKAKLREDRMEATHSNETRAMRCHGRRCLHRGEGTSCVTRW